jgi:hypothetical protein
MFSISTPFFYVLDAVDNSPALSARDGSMNFGSRDSVVLFVAKRSLKLKGAVVVNRFEEEE